MYLRSFCEKERQIIIYCHFTGKYGEIYFKKRDQAANYAGALQRKFYLLDKLEVI